MKNEKRSTKSREAEVAGSSVISWIVFVRGKKREAKVSEAALTQ